DLLGGGNYPFTEPVVVFTSRPVPWSSHVHPATGVVCLGNGWESADGGVLLGQLVVHVARLMNLDEPDLGEYGYNRASSQYWRDTLGSKPYLPDLTYPALPADLTHAASGAGFRAVRAPQVSDAFRPKDRASTVFKKIG